MPTGQIVSFDDLVHGEQRFNTDDIGDFIIRRADGSTAFFFSNAIDDALMGVTLVLRGDDHLTNTPRQMLILQALGLPVPQYAHVALLLGMDGAPLSKRHGDLSLRDLRRRGYLPGAVRNHLVRLGHTCVTDGWLDDAAMRAEFDLNRLGRAAAKFDEAQLRALAEGGGRASVRRRVPAWIAAQLPDRRRARELAARSPARFDHNVDFPADAKLWADVVFGDRRLTGAEDALAAIREAGADFFARRRKCWRGQRSEFKQAARELGQPTRPQGPGVVHAAARGSDRRDAWAGAGAAAGADPGR